jgi:membrane protease YdiL (CAAX protease family)
LFFLAVEQSGKGTAQPGGARNLFERKNTVTVLRIRQRWERAGQEWRKLNNIPSFRQTSISLVYLALITIAELVTTMGDPKVGVSLHAMVLTILLLHASTINKGMMRRFVILLSLAPMIRILSLSIPLSQLGLPIIYWYLVIGVLLAIAAVVAGRIAGLEWRRIGMTTRHWPMQSLLGLVGLGLGLVEYWILKPGPLAAVMNLEDIIISIFILLFFTGVLEEFIFRGLLQSASMQVLGKFGLVYVAILFAVLHLGYKSVSDLVFVLLVGLLFGWMAWKTQSLWGASLAHGIANICLYVFFPFFLGSGATPVSSADGVVAMVATPEPVSQAYQNATVSASLALPPVNAVVDDSDPGLLHTGNNLWLDSTHGYGGSFLWTYAAQSVPDVVVTWFPTLQGCGLYRVEAFIPEGIGLTDSARYAVTHRGGGTTVQISQAVYSGKWAPLGSYEFEAGASAYIQLSNLTGEDPKILRWVVFDAVRWTIVRPCAATAGAPPRPSVTSVQ